MKMDSFEKMMEAEGAKPAKDDFKELVDFIVDNRNDPWAIEDAIAAYSDKLQTQNYKRGYEDAIELLEDARDFFISSYASLIIFPKKHAK